MTTSAGSSASPAPAPRLRLLPLLAGLLLIAATGIAIWLIQQSTDAPSRPPATAALPVVEVLDSTPQDHPVRIHAWGRVSDEDAVELYPQVEGRLQRLHPQLLPGGTIPAGETLAEIDPSDYALGVKAAEAGLAKAEARLAIEGARRKVAGKELRMLEKADKLDQRSRALVLREPQLREARAEVAAARHALEKARLQLARTRLRLPYEVRVLARDHQVPEVVGPGKRIARLHPTAAITVRLLIDPALLSRLRRAEDSETSARVELLANGHRYPGTVQTIEAVLNDTSRQVPLRVRVDDPFGVQKPHADRPPLLLGALVEGWIDAGVLRQAVTVPRELLQDNQRVWVVDKEGRLRVRRVKIRFGEPGRVFIAPLPQGDRLLRGNPGGLAPGTRVKVREPS